MKPHKHDMRMKRIIHFALLVISAIAFLTSCEKAPFITMTGPRSFNFTRDGGSQSITFTCNRPWSVSSTESWIQISPLSGEASDKEITITIKCMPNTTYDPRSATVTVKLEELSESITITQDTGIGLLVSPTTFELTNAAQVIEIEVQKNVQYSVAIDDESAKWIKQGGTKALTTDKVTFTISANESYDNREGKITFKQLDGDLSQTVTVRQSQTNGLFITTPDYNLSNEAHTLSVEVKANVEFEVTSQTEWIKYVETKALTPSTITLSVEANETYDNRTGTVLVKQKNGDLTGTITVTQKQTDYLTVTPTSFEVDDKAQNVTIEVKDNVAYSVVIPDEAKDWISVSSNTQTKALVDDVVVLAIAANTTYDAREASVTIKQTDGSLAGTISIKQAFMAGLIPDKSSYDIDRLGGTLEVGVHTNVEYEVTTEDAWIHYVQTKALSASTVVLNVDENETYSAREGKVQLTQKNGSLKQTITIKQAGRIAVTSVSLNKTKLLLEEGDTETLSATVKPDDATDKTVTWTSSDNSIAIVDNSGKVTAVKEGSVTITAKAGEMSDNCALTVKNAPEGAVHLGLSVFWATCNIGASKPEEYGDYYAWGEIETKDSYTWENYKWGRIPDPGLTKYNTYSLNGVVDNKLELDPEDDVVRVKLGNNWRMPSESELKELENTKVDTNYKWEWLEIKGHYGWQVTFIVNNKTIFFPAAGIMTASYLSGSNSEGGYWGSTCAGSGTAYGFYLTDNWFNFGHSERPYGKSIRPVTD